MHYYEVAPTQIVRAGQDSFIYSSESPLLIGQIVRIPLGTKHLNGLVLGQATLPSFVVKPVSSILEPTPLPKPHIVLAQWLSKYYNTPLATVLQTLLPRGLETKRRVRKNNQHVSRRNRTHFLLNKAQQQAVQSVVSSAPGTSLLHGVTGSGKTAVYIELAKRSLENGKSTIILVPEIALTSQLIDEFSHHFKNIIITHSRQTEAERHHAWRQALISSVPCVVIGPRSALFMPLASIGLIVIDEAHEPSYKQEQSPRYSALRAAHTLAVEHRARLVLGSATPLVSDYYTAKHTGRPIFELPTPAVPQRAAPTVTVVDMTKRTNFHRHKFFSDTLLSQLEADFASNKQVLIFHNRRGSASVTLCENCGWQAGCPRCFIPLTLHGDNFHMRCHICGMNSKVPTSCPECGRVGVIHKGIGTKLIESELRRLFPHKIIARFDGDTSSEDTVEARYKELYNGTIDCIIGTQVISKGLDLPHLHTVGVVQADAGLSLPDYTSGERTFQLLAQVIGRVGRSTHDTNVIVQSYQPTHPIVQAGIAQDYTSFYERTLTQRRRGLFPPYTHLLKLVCIYKTEAAAIKNSKALAATLQKNVASDVQILGPTPAFYERVRDTYRWQLVVKSPRRTDLVEILTLLPSTHWQFELDPISLL